ncbi:MAG: FAD-dependent oxidoreductase [Clostridia bacterium]|nr:FAD-dependent oxidoreductase [Clostridia bacterium]
MSRYVIIGNGTASVGAIEGIRSVDKTGSITVISEEDRPAYCRPLISYYLEGKTKLENIGMRGADYYSDSAAELLCGRKAVGIDADRRTVALDDGEVLPYDRLCVCTGSSPFVPPFEGLGTVEKQFTFMTLDSALGIEKSIDAASRVLIVGAGLIGLKCAEGLTGRVASVTVCDLADRVLSSILDADCAALMQRHLEEHGMEFLLGDSAVRFDGNTAYMRSGRTVGFDVLILAVGVRANTSLISGIGGEVNRGIVVDERMATSVDGIFAAGDCAEGFDASSGGKRVLAILPNAYMQGHAAGVNMAGGSEVFDKGIPMNSIGFFGLHAMSAGVYEGEMYEERTDTSIKRLFTKDGLLKGFILIGRSERAGIYTSMIREKIPLSSVDFELLKRSATTAAFPPESRRKMFGGAV